DGRHRPRPRSADQPHHIARPDRALQTIPPGTDLSYSWTQALNDLGQISPIVAVTGFFLLAIVTDLVLPRSRRGGAVAMVAVVGFAYSLGTVLYRWVYATGGYAYHRFATGDNFAL